jgi:hypothetical protein
MIRIAIAKAFEAIAATPLAHIRSPHPRSVWGLGVVGSNPVTPTTQTHEVIEFI